jgi:4-amino-4-deoxy-L-arabinose transferase-like glycosyltransferase
LGIGKDSAMDRLKRSELWRHHGLILLVAGLVFLTNLGAATLFDEDEPKNAVCGREMFLRGDWIVPTFNAELRTDKPILIYWIMLCSYSVFGVSEFAARFGSSVLAIGTSLLTYHLGRRLFDPKVGLLGAVILCTCLMFSVVGRSVTPDSTLIFCTTSAFFAYVWAVSSRTGGTFGEPEYGTGRRRAWDEYAPLTSLAAVPMYLAMGLAVLAKGPIGVLLPCAIIGLHLLVRQQLDVVLERGAAVEPRPAWWRRAITTLLEVFYPSRIGAGILAMRVPLGAVLVAAVALPWYVAVGQATDGAWLAGFLGDHNVGRFLEAKENHSGPFFYYAVVIFLGTFPWSVLLPAAVWQLCRDVKAGSPWSPGLIFLACWAGFWITFFSGASTKLPNYILPAYPAVALLIAHGLVAWQTAAAPVITRAVRYGTFALLGVGVVLLIAVPIATSLFLPQETWLVILGMMPLVGGLLAWRALRRERHGRLIRIYSVTAVLLATTIVGIAPAYVSKYQDGPHFGALARQLAADRPTELATYDYFAPTLVFYAQTPVTKLRKPHDIPKYFDEHPQGLLLTRADRLEDLQHELPADVTVLDRQRRFLRRHDLVLLGRPEGTSAIRTVSAERAPSEPTRTSQR